MRRHTPGMAGRLLRGILLVACFATACAIAAEDAVDTPRKVKSLVDYDIPGLKKTLPFDTKGAMELVAFIETFASQEVGGNLNVVMSPKVKGTIRLTLKDVAIGDALEIALTANNLAYEIRGEGERAIINIMTDEEFRALHGVGFYEPREVKIIELKYAPPSRVSKMLEGVISTIGRQIYDDVSGTLVLIDTPDKLREMERIVATAELPTIEREIPTVTRAFTLQYAEVAEVEEQVKSLLTKDVGSMTVNTKSKTILVTDVERAMGRVSKLIATFDRKPKQVAIQAKIVEVELTEQNSMGINWSHVLDGIGPRFRIESDVPLSSASGPSLTYRTIVGGGDLSVLVDALKSVGDTKVISNPHISVVDGTEATIKVVRKQPYKEVAFESGTTNVIGVSYKFEEIGTTLSVTPKINDENFVSVAIKPTISDLVDWYDAPGGSGGVVGIPVIKRAEAETTVTVKDGVTIIIGGMIKNEKSESNVGVPILRSIPIIGRLFRSTTQKNKKFETIVFITPKIISGEEPFLQKPEQDKPLKFRAAKPRAMKNRAETTPAE